MISLFFLISLFWFNFQRLSAISKLHLCFLSHISNFIFDQSAFLTCLSKSLDEFLILTVSGFTSFNEYFYHFHFYNFSFYHIYIYIYSFSYQSHICNIWKFPGQRSNWSCSYQPTPQPQQHQIQGASTTYATARSNARSLTH